MSCSPFDLKDYFLKELPDPQARKTEAHVRTCVSCREELDRLSITEAALFALRDEEIPQRIAFVSDPVFEPSPARRWWAALWSSGPRLGFVSAAMLSAAILVSAFMRPPQPAAPLVGTPAVQTISAEDVQARIDQAVAKAVSESEARQEARQNLLVADFERRERRNRQELLYAAQTLQRAERVNRAQNASYYRTAGDIQ